MSRFDSAREDALAKRIPLDLHADLDADLRQGEEDEQISTNMPARDPAAVTAGSLHAAYGNELVSSALSGAEPSGLASLIAGDLAMGAVGVASSGALDSNTAMQSALRDAGTLDHDPSHPSLRQLRASGGAPLPEALRAKMEAAFGHSFEHVRIHTDSTAGVQSQALNAHAFTIGNHIWFGAGEFAPGTPQGDRLLAHELTHVVQADEGRIGSTGGEGLDVSSPTDRLEQEAYGNEDRIVSAMPSSSEALDMVSGPDTPTQAPSQGAVLDHGAQVTGGDASGLALREAKSATSPAPSASPKANKGRPDTVELKLGSKKFDVSLVKGSTELRQTIPLNLELAPGIKLTQATLDFDKKWKVTGGQLAGKLTVGTLIDRHPVTIDVEKGGKIGTTIKDVPIPFGDIVTGKMDLTLSNQGVSTETTLTHESFDLGPSFSLASGKVVVKLNTAGQNSVDGELKGLIGGLVDFTLTTGLAENRIRGQLNTSLKSPVDLGAGVSLTGVSLTGGVFMGDNCQITGGVTLAFGELATGEVDATYSFTLGASDKGADAPGGAGAAPEAAPEAAAAPETAPQSQAAAPAKADQPQGAPPSDTPQAQVAQAPAGGDLEAPGLDTAQGPQEGPGLGSQEAAAGGEKAPATPGPLKLDLPGDGAWHFTGSIAQTKDVELSEGVTVTGTELDVLVDDNTLQPVVTRTTLLLAAGWQVELDGVYDPSAKAFYGNGTATLTESLAMGDSGLTVTALEGNVAVEANEVTNITGKVTLVVDRPGVPKLTIVVSDVDYEVASGDFSGVGEVTLDERVSMGKQGAYDLFLDTGTTATATIEAGQLTTVDGQIELLLVDGEEDFVKASLNTSYDVAKGTLTGSATATLVSERQVAEMDGGSIWLAADSDLTAIIQENKLTDIAGSIKLSIRDTEGEWCKASLDGSYDLANGTGYTGSAEISLSRQYSIAKVGAYELVLPANGVSATANFEDSSLKSLEGQVPISILDGGEGALFTGGIEGTYTFGDKSFSGEGNLTLARDMTYDVGAGLSVSVLTGTGGAAKLSGNGVDELSGAVKANILHDGEVEATFVGFGRYDVATDSIIEASGTITLVRTLEPLGTDVVKVSGITGEGTLKQNALDEVAGSAKVAIPKLNNAEGALGITWSKKDGVDHIAGEGDLHVQLIKSADGKRGAEGDVRFTFDGTDKFTAAGLIDYQLTEQIGGKVGVSMDQNLDPKVAGELQLNSELIPASDLFRQELPLVPEVNIPLAAGPVPMVFKFGASAGFGLGVQALALSSKIGISDWYPLRDASSVPQFDAGAKLSWGLNLDAMAAAWMSLGVGVSALSVGAGLKGESKLDVPLTTAVDVNLHGQGNEFWGDLGVSMKLSADLSFAAKPYLYANLFNQRWDHDFEGWTVQLKDIFAFEWGTTYEFGDRQGQRQGSAAELSAGAAQQSETLHDKAPAKGESKVNAPKAAPGGPDLSGIADLLNKGEEPDVDMEKRLSLIQDVAEGIGAFGYLASLFGDALAAMAVAGPIGLPIMLVYKLLKGEFSWQKLVDAVKGAIKGAKAVYELVKPYLPSWWEKIKEIVAKGLNILDEWWNGDTRMHKAVQAGEHNYANPEMLGMMADRMLDTWADEAHKRSVLTILETATKKGCVGTVVAKVGLDALKSKMTGMWTASDVEERWKNWAVANGYARYERESHWFGDDTYEFKYTR